MLDCRGYQDPVVTPEPPAETATKASKDLGVTTVSAGGVANLVSHIASTTSRLLMFPGRRGDEGSRGPRGDQGERGVSGERGERGPRGERGQATRCTRGDAGPSSSTDSAGASGPGPLGLVRASVVSTHGHISFAEINALTPERLVQFDAALIAFVRHWLSPTLNAGYSNEGVLSALNAFLTEYGVWFSVTEYAPYVKRGRNLDMSLGVRAGSFMAHHSIQFITSPHYWSFICWQVISDLLVFRGLETSK